MGGKNPSHLWDGGFTDPMHPALEAISCGVDQDLPLAAADLTASAAWAGALGRCGALDAGDADLLARTLAAMSADLEAGRWVPGPAEDVHTAIEAELTRRAGPAGGRIHTGRSRNDQVATAFRMAVRGRVDDVTAAARSLQRALLRRAEEDSDTILPSFTHLQPAQPVRLAHWILSHFWPIDRDVRRLADARRRADVMPLGSGAATGTAWPIDREDLARRLGFSACSENSLDAVGDRDFALECVFACAMVACHLSRLAEDLVVWSSPAFGFIAWPDSLATGSSLMPNKKNPDLAELVRGRSAAALGDLVSLLALIKGLPVGYQRDLQESKPPVWRATTAARASLEAMTAAVEGCRFMRDRMAEALTDDLLATEVADVLVRRGHPFREAHGAVARAVRTARDRGVALTALPADDLPAPIRPEDLRGLDAERAVEARTATGGTSRAALAEQMDRARAALEGA